MAEYRYMGVDLKTRKVVEDLPLYGVSLTRRISGPGNMTGSFKLGTGLFSDLDLLAGSEPGRVALVVLRDNVVIWAGPIWSRTYQSQAQVCQLTGQTYESIFSVMVNVSTLTYPATDQLTIFKNLIDWMQGGVTVNTNYGFDTSYIGTSGVLRDFTVNYYDFEFYSKLIDNLLKQSNSFDYMLDPYLDANEVLQIPVRTGYPYLGYGQEGIAIDYPGQVTNYYWSESAARGGVFFYMLGAGEGSKQLWSTASNDDLLAAGYMPISKLLSDKSITDKTTLDRIAIAAKDRYSIPVVNPTVDIKLTEDIEFGEWNNLGVPVSVTIEDARFPEQTTFSRRMLGWDLTPQSSESVDMLKLVLEGNDNG